MRLAHVLTQALLIIFCMAQVQPAADGTLFANEMTLMNGQILAEQAKEQEEREEQLPSFIVQQFKQMQKFQETFHEKEAFLVTIPSGGSYLFKYNIQSNPNPSMAVQFFTNQNGDDISIFRQHEQDEYIEISSSTNLYGRFNSLGKAYARKFINFGSYSGADLFVKLESKLQVNVIAEIRLSGPPSKIDRDNVIKNDNFTVIVKKLAAIQQEMKQVEDANRFKFKFQWGFLQREEHYEQEMLKLTGVQAFVILATAIVQMYCIKNLFDKNGIV